MTRTPGPWVTDGPYYVFDNGKNCVAITDTDTAPLDVMKANAAFIVLAVNAHDALVEALNGYLLAEPQCDCSEHSGCRMATARSKARAALAFAQQPPLPNGETKTVNTTTQSNERTVSAVPLDLRDWFAGQALAGFMANTKRPTTFAVDDAVWAYKIADAMLTERQT